MAAINVKVKTSKVIAALENKLAELEKAKATNEKLEAEFVAANTAHDVAMEKWQKDCAKIITKAGRVEEVGSRGWYNANQYTVTYKVPADLVLPEKPTRPERPDYVECDNVAIPQIKSAIRILQMTDEETVNASTFKQISKYL